MGVCKDCGWYGIGSGLFSDYGYCKRFSGYDEFKKKDIRYKVKPNDSCDKFYLKETLSNSNFKSGEKEGCFLTSACVEYLGKADDCKELTELRSFRDGYMKSVDGGEDLIKEYYSVAPKIVEFINTSDKKDKYYEYINEVIEKCVKLIALKENERVLAEYKFMVENLKKEFNI